MRKKYVLKNKKRFFIFIFVLTVLTASIFAMPSAYGYNEKECVTVIVKEGDTLWNIASSHYESGDIRKHIYEIKKKNNLTSSAIYPGDVLYLP